MLPARRFAYRSGGPGVVSRTPGVLVSSAREHLVNHRAQNEL
jgi:hypothetical protein